MAGPLKGITVIEMAGIGPCPLAGQLLADLGADVISIDRANAPADKTDVNRRGKRSVVLDLKSTEGHAAALALINRSDILLEGFRPGVMERLGLGPEHVNARVIYGRITGWGQTGPMSQMAGHDINFLGLTGALAAMGDKGKPPPPPLNLVGDYAGGTMFLLFGVMAALVERNTSGKGQVVDAAMVEGVSAMMSLFHTFQARGEWQSDRQSNLLDGGAPFYRTYQTKDKRYMSVGPLEPQFHQILLELADLPQSHADTQNDRTTWEARSEMYAQVFAKKTQAQWSDIFNGSDACVTPVLDMHDAPNHPHVAERGIFETIDGVLQATPAPRFSRSKVDSLKPPQAIGEATHEILDSLAGEPHEST